MVARLRRPSWVLLIELFIGFGWLRAAIEKLIDPSWWTGDGIRVFIAEHADLAVDWYAPISTDVWYRFAAPLAVGVAALQLVAAIALVSGRRVGIGLAVGMLLNLHFVMAGAVDPSIFYLVCQGALALHLLERRRDAAATELLQWLNVGSVALAAAMIPMVRTLHPADVIADPAIVLATFGGLMFVTTALVLMRRAADAVPQPPQGAAGAIERGAAPRSVGQ